MLETDYMPEVTFPDPPTDEEILAFYEDWDPSGIPVYGGGEEED